MPRRMIFSETHIHDPANLFANLAYYFPILLRPANRQPLDVVPLHKYPGWPPLVPRLTALDDPQGEHGRLVCWG